MALSSTRSLTRATWKRKRTCTRFWSRWSLSSSSKMVSSKKMGKMIQSSWPTKLWRTCFQKNSLISSSMDRNMTSHNLSQNTMICLRSMRMSLLVNPLWSTKLRKSTVSGKVKSVHSTICSPSSLDTMMMLWSRTFLTSFQRLPPFRRTSKNSSALRMMRKLKHFCLS